MTPRPRRRTRRCPDRRRGPHPRRRRWSARRRRACWRRDASRPGRCRWSCRTARGPWRTRPPSPGWPSSRRPLRPTPGSGTPCAPAARRRASTRSSATVTPRSATDPTLRVVSRDSSALTVTPSAVGVDDHHVVTRDEHQHVGVGCTEHRRALPGDDRDPSRRRRCRTGRVRRPSCRRPARKQLGAKRIGRAPVDHHARRPPSAGTVPGSTRGLGPPARSPVPQARSPNRRAPRRWPAPASPIPRRPSTRRRDATDPPSSVARALARVDSRVNWPIAASARSWCSSVMASADLLTLEVLLPLTGVRWKVNPHSGRPRGCDPDHIPASNVQLVDNLRMLPFVNRRSGVHSGNDGSAGRPAPRALLVETRPLVSPRRPFRLSVGDECRVGVAAGYRETP